MPISQVKRIKTNDMKKDKILHLQLGNKKYKAIFEQKDKSCIRLKRSPTSLYKVTDKNGYQIEFDFLRLSNAKTRQKANFKMSGIYIVEGGDIFVFFKLPKP